MKTFVTAIAATFFAAGVNATDIYHGFERGNPDLLGAWAKSEQVTAAQPGVGASFDRYNGWADGNPDIFRSTPSASRPSQSPDHYGTFNDGNPDLQ
jgi:hypothetical protein